MKKNREKSFMQKRKPFLAKRLLLLFLVVNVFSFQTLANLQGEILELEMTGGSLIEVFAKVKEKTNYTFLYNVDDIKEVNNVTISASPKSVQTILTDCLKDTGLTYEIRDEVIIIKPAAKPVTPAKEEKPVVEEKKVGGVVTDNTGVGLPGVSVFIKGTSIGTTTNIDGKYNIQLPDASEAILVFSFIGMDTQEITVTNQKVIDVVLTAGSEQIDEVVVTGYQKIDRRLFTGSAAKISTEEVKLAASPDVSRFLQGTVAGVSVDNVSGTFGAAPVVRIRGNASINGNNKPLWVVDGVILEDLVEVTADDLTSGNLSTVLSSGVAGLNPDDIEDIQVLKDASATALYGAQAMNGVIVINTKKGKIGKMQVSYAGNLTVKERPNYSQFDIANSASEISFYKELQRKGWIDLASSVKARDYGVLGKMYDQIDKGIINWGPDGSLNEEFLSKYGNANTDWFKTLFKNSISQQHSFSFSGGTEKAKYYASISLYDDSGSTIADNVTKYTATMKGDFKVTDKLDIGIKLTTNHRDQKLPGSKDRDFNAIDGVYQRDFDINPFSYALNTSRSIRAYDDKGDLEFFRRDYSPFNIIHELDNNTVDLVATDVIGQLNLNYEIATNLNFSSVFQARRNSALREHKIHESSNQANAYRAMDTQFIRDANQLLFRDPDKPNSNPISILPTGGFYNTVNNTLDFYSIRNSVSWNPTIEDTHIMSFLLGQEVKYTNRKEITSDGWGVQYDRGGLFNEHPDLSKYLSLNNQTREGIEEYRDRYIGYFLNGAYSYKGKYTFNGTIRRDGSNKLGKTKAARHLNSWNLSGKWNLSEENFLADSEKINLLSLKATYGLNGTMGPNASAIQKLVAYQSWRPYDKETGVKVEDLANEDLSWEKMYEFSVGAEAAFFNNRVYTDIAYYKRNAFDLVGAVRTSGIGGDALKYGNFADMEIEGFEVALNTVNITHDNFKWTTSINVDYNTSEITKLENVDRIGDYVRNTGGDYLGKPRRGLYSVRFDGLTNQGLPTFINSAGNPINENVNFQTSENVMDYLKYEGVLDAPISGGMTNTFKYKDFSLGIGIVFRAGNKVRLDDLFKLGSTGLRQFGYSSISKDMENRWFSPGDENFTTVPAILNRRFDKDLDTQSLNLYELYNKSDVRVADGGFIRLKTISLGYNLPKSFTNNLGIQRAKISLQAQNILLLYSDKKLNGLDPEFYRSGGVSLPIPRTFTFSLNVGF
ncbi:SusC/RagA family TonB-linked outer membrane protein [Labilibaculum euxinus]|uniref:SusC/RagA family TonB-linked outer membrane protein n=1 Tax=Labilibaculum euxinus TaxID=2686357 RepID=A0A7M4D3Z2_9BACT|nr:SusC/RagA family TonB-linked outer membrane protein [Labilibaculum euxinus]MUP37371.1 SusC/RagA family TonB-linked outer membrane protein [Labilibaculum euxinus]MVB06576.1 SusC/RagA family TonB-linked outer membrane protein [Labilibaculum euxinus]